MTDTIEFPLYLKRKDDEAPPEEPIAFIVGRDGVFVQKRTVAFRAVVKAQELPMLKEVGEEAEYVLPPAPANIAMQCLRFFREVYKRHRSEAILILSYNKDTGEFRLDSPEQNATAAHCRYVPRERRPGFMPIGTIHSHGTMGAFFSGTDDHDDNTMDGIHLVFGKIESERIAVSARLVISGKFFKQDPERVLAGLRFLPEEKAVYEDVKVEEKTTASTYGREIPTEAGFWRWVGSVASIFFGRKPVQPEPVSCPTSVSTHWNPSAVIGYGSRSYTSSRLVSPFKDSGYVVEIPEGIDPEDCDPCPGWYEQVNRPTPVTVTVKSGGKRRKRRDGPSHYNPKTSKWEFDEEDGDEEDDDAMVVLGAAMRGSVLYDHGAIGRGTVSAPEDFDARYDRLELASVGLGPRGPLERPLPPPIDFSPHGSNGSGVRVVDTEYEPSCGDGPVGDAKVVATQPQGLGVDATSGSVTIPIDGQTEEAAREDLDASRGHADGVEPANDAPRAETARDVVADVQTSGETPCDLTKDESSRLAFLELKAEKTPDEVSEYLYLVARRDRQVSPSIDFFPDAVLGEKEVALGSGKVEADVPNLVTAEGEFAEVIATVAASEAAADAAGSQVGATVVATSETPPATGSVSDDGKDDAAGPESAEPGTVTGDKVEPGEQLEALTIINVDENFLVGKGNVVGKDKNGKEIVIGSKVRADELVDDRSTERGRFAFELVRLGKVFTVVHYETSAFGIMLYLHAGYTFGKGETTKASSAGIPEHLKENSYWWNGIVFAFVDKCVLYEGGNGVAKIETASVAVKPAEEDLIPETLSEAQIAALGEAGITLEEFALLVEAKKKQLPVKGNAALEAVYARYEKMIESRHQYRIGESITVLDKFVISRGAAAGKDRDNRDLKVGDRVRMRSAILSNGGKMRTVYPSSVVATIVHVGRKDEITLLYLHTGIYIDAEWPIGKTVIGQVDVPSELQTDKRWIGCVVFAEPGNCELEDWYKRDARVPRRESGTDLPLRASAAAGTRSRSFMVGKYFMVSPGSFCGKGKCGKTIRVGDVVKPSVATMLNKRGGKDITTIYPQRDFVVVHKGTAYDKKGKPEGVWLYLHSGMSLGNTWPKGKICGEAETPQDLHDNPHWIGGIVWAKIEDCELVEARHETPMTVGEVGHRSVKGRVEKVEKSDGKGKVLPRADESGGKDKPDSRATKH